MKKLVVYFIFLAGILAFNAQAKDNDRWMAIGVSPLAGIVGVLDINYQIKATDYLAITLPLRFGYDWYYKRLASVLLDRKESKNNIAPISFSGGIGTKFLMASNGFNDSFYLEPRLSIGYQQIGLSGVDFEIKAWTLTPMARLGWDWFYESGFYMSLGGGAGMNWAISKKTKYGLIEKEIIKSYGFLLGVSDRKISPAWDLEFKIGFSW
jgi:hypothetical protein